MTHPSSIPKPSIPLPKSIKRNVPIPLRGTRPSKTRAQDLPVPPSVAPLRARTIAASPARPNVPAVHPYSARNNDSRRVSSPPPYSRGGRSVWSDNGAASEAETGKTSQEIRRESEIGSEPDDKPFSPGLERIMARLEAEVSPDTANMPIASTSPRDSEINKPGHVEREANRASLSRSDSLRRHRTTNSMARSNLTSSPRSFMKRSSVRLEGSDDLRKKKSVSRRSIGAVHPTWRTSLDAPLARTPTRSPPPPPSDPYAILRELETLLGPETVAATIDLPRVILAHDACPSPSASSLQTEASVFGVPICTAARYASCSTTLGGQTHALPIVVFAAIEELYRLGLKSPRLLRPAGTNSETTLPSLVAKFDSGPTFGDAPDLPRIRAPLDDISALLLTYLSCLPGPVIPRALLPALYRVLSDSNMAAGRLLLRLLPTPHFSLLLYLLAFFAQLQTYQSANGWNTIEIAKTFTRAVCGTGEEGEGVLEWLVRNWDELSVGLFPSRVPSPAEGDLLARMETLQKKHAAEVRAAYEEGAAAERKTWLVEVEALREASEREGKILRGIVKRFAEGAPRNVR